MYHGNSAGVRYIISFVSQSYSLYFNHLEAVGPENQPCFFIYREWTIWDLKITSTVT